MDGWDHWTTFPLEHRSVSGANKHQNHKFKFTIFMRQGMYFIYIHLSIVLELFNWGLKRTAFYPLIVTDLANLFHCLSDVSWGPTQRASDGRSGTQGGTCKYDMIVQFLMHHPFKQGDSWIRKLFAELLGKYKTLLSLEFLTHQRWIMNT